MLFIWEKWGDVRDREGKKTNKREEKMNKDE